ncbi:DUF2971 domain-containing protein [Pseudophaeobacter arcticus]|uniref:DUF2971 domain-containing protein n=1 Tax=Pseudophaeobacter arcticus TaxID=385492 RepID=UPI003A9881CE
MQRLYYRTGRKYALDNLEKRRLKLSFSNTVNDPYELMPFNFGNDERGEKLWFAWKECREKNALDQGFISFSKNFSSPAMWGHYADNHKGVAYGFDVLPSQKNKLVKIIYKPELKKFENRDLTCEETQQREIKYASQTKSSHWSYEDEWRIYCSLGDVEKYQKSIGRELFYLPFGSEIVLREVIIGAESDLSTSQVKAALREGHSVDVRKANLSKEKYEIIAR